MKNLREDLHMKQEMQQRERYLQKLRKDWEDSQMFLDWVKNRMKEVRNEDRK